VPRSQDPRSWKRVQIEEAKESNPIYPLLARRGQWYAPDPISKKKKEKSDRKDFFFLFLLEQRL
jgi:hypothetical protein